jgi:nucleotide-binding universal stress UspA family protein
MKNAILGSDLSAASDQIIENAREFKLLGIEKIILVYVVNRRNVDDFSISDKNATQVKLKKQQNRLISFGFEAETRIAEGPPALELMKEAKICNAGLVILGSRGNSLTSQTIGATASETLHHMKCPVLIMVFDKEEERKMQLLHKSLNRHILFATDFSDFSENAFQVLKNQVTSADQLTLMHIQDVARISKHLEDKLEEFNKIDTARLERMKEEFNHVHPETKVRIALDYGHPKQLIPRFIKNNEVTLTVMGSQGRGYIGEFFLGSVSLRVARHADSNLLIIPFQRKP